jgi:hypothetical protein
VAKAKDTAKIERLRNLSTSPDAQIEYALRLVQAEHHPDVIQAALDVLAATADPRARLAIVDAYAACTDGRRHDPGCYMRTALMQALRHMGSRDDVGMVEQAVSTYEFMPPFTGPTEGEVAAGLRSVALITLNEIDETLAGYHSVRLLVDRYTSSMSGEPAVTAARVLAAQDQILPLYAYVLRAEPDVPEVVGECLRHLTALPASLLAPLVERYLASADEIVLLGLFDLLLAHEAQTIFTATVLDFLRTTRFYNLYRYLVSTIVAGRRDGLIAPLEALVATEEDRLKVEILQQALELR